MRLLYGGWGVGLFDGGRRSRLYWEWRVVYMGVYYANLSIVQFRAMMLGIHVYVYIGYITYNQCIHIHSQYHSSKLYKT